MSAFPFFEIPKSYVDVIPNRFSGEESAVWQMQIPRG
jgi:hypothetical protein